jgi:hypothetical protein
MQIHIIIYLCEHGAVIVGLISTTGIGWRPSPRHPPHSALIGGVSEEGLPQNWMDVLSHRGYNILGLRDPGGDGS